MAELILEIVEGEDAGRQTPLDGSVEIGRDASNGLALDDEQASRRHARVSAQGDHAMVEDLGSTQRHIPERAADRGPSARCGRATDPARRPHRLRAAHRGRTSSASPRRYPIPQLPDVSHGGARAGARGRARARAPAGGASPAFATDESAPGFVPPEVADDAEARTDYGAVARLVDTSVKRQTHIATFALLAAAGLAVLLVFGLK